MRPAGRLRQGWVVSALLAATTGAAHAQTPAARAGEYLEELWRASGVPSVAVTVARDHRLVFSDAVGYAELDNRVPASPRTVYNVGSISKVLATAAVMQWVEAGRVDLDDPIQTWVPEFPTKAWPVTLRHILTHTSGIRHYRANDFPRGTESDNVGTYHSVAEALELFADDPLLFEPGTHYSYTSYGVNLLQGVVESVSGMRFERYMIEHVWSPAGMRSSRFDWPDRIVQGRARGYRMVEGRPAPYYPDENVTYKFAGGGMLSTSEDLVRFGLALLEGHLMNPVTVAEMFAPQLRDVPVFEGDGRAPTPLRWEQGLMWRIRRDEMGRPYLNHCGQVKGFNACLIMYVEEGLVAAVIDNGSGAGVMLRQAREFADLFR